MVWWWRPGGAAALRQSVIWRLPRPTAASSSRDDPCPVGSQASDALPPTAARAGCSPGSTAGPVALYRIDRAAAQIVPVAEATEAGAAGGRPAGDVLALGVAPSGEAAAVLGDDGTVRIHSLVEPGGLIALRAAWPGGLAPVTSLCWPAEDVLVLGHADGVWRSVRSEDLESTASSPQVAAAGSRMALAPVHADNSGWACLVIEPLPQGAARVLHAAERSAEEMVARRIAARNIAGALALCVQHGLDPDALSRARWEGGAPTAALVRAALAAVSDAKYVAQAVLHTVPTDAESAVQLYRLGLLLTDEHPALAELRAGAAPVEPFDPLQQLLCECRVACLHGMDRLALYEEMRRESSAPFSAESFAELVLMHEADVAFKLARAGEFTTLRRIACHLAPALVPFWPAVLLSIPETTEPSRFVRLLDTLHTEPLIGADEVHRSLVPQPWRSERDWSEALGLPGPSRTEPAALHAHLGLIDVNVMVGGAKGWYLARAEVVEAVGLAEMAFQTVALGCDRGVTGLDDLMAHLRALCAIVYRGDAVGATLTLSAFRSMALAERLALLLAPCASKTIAADLLHLVTPYLRQLDSPPGARVAAFAELLQQLACKRGLRCLFAIVTGTARPLVLAGYPQAFAEADVAAAAIAAVFACPDVDKDVLLCASDILAWAEQLGPVRRPSAGHRTALHPSPPHFPPQARRPGDQLSTAIQRLRAHVDACSVLEELEEAHTPASLARWAALAETTVLDRMVASVVRRAAGTNPRRQWVAVALELRRTLQAVLPASTGDGLAEAVLRAVLSSGCDAAIDAVPQLIGPPPALASPPTAQRLAIAVAQEYFNSANAPDDTCLELAEQCLGLVNDTPQAVAERRLIAGVRLAHSALGLVRRPSLPTGAPWSDSQPRSPGCHSDAGAAKPTPPGVHRAGSTGVPGCAQARGRRGIRSGRLAGRRSWGHQRRARCHPGSAHLGARCAAARGFGACCGADHRVGGPGVCSGVEAGPRAGAAPHPLRPAGWT